MGPRVNGFVWENRDFRSADHHIPGNGSLSSERYMISTFYDNGDGGDDNAFYIEMLMKFLEPQGAHTRRLCAFVHHAVFEPSPSKKHLHASCYLHTSSDFWHPFFQSFCGSLCACDINLSGWRRPIFPYRPAVFLSSAVHIKRWHQIDSHVNKGGGEGSQRCETCLQAVAACIYGICSWEAWHHTYTLTLEQ